MKSIHRYFLAPAVAIALGSAAMDAARADTSRAAPRWTERLLQELPRIDAESPARLGVHVRDLDTGVSASYQADRYWYIASMVKVPVAIAVLRAVERGQHTLDTMVTLRASDYVDGPGLTSGHPVGTALSIRFLLEQMIVQSDNTASDALIDLVGIAEVNAVVASLVPDGFRRITSLGDVRRMIYGQVVPDAERLRGQDLLLLHRQKNDVERLQLLSSLVGTPVARLRASGTLDPAYNAYYASGVNSARLDAYGELLAALVEGRALQPATTDYLLNVMQRVATGTRRIKAGLPPGVTFAHKTGTQRRRSCDAGLLQFTEAGRSRRVIVVACTRDEKSLAFSEAVLMQVGAAICRSGLLTEGVVDAPSCHVVPPAGGLAASSAER
ncbi:MAG: serine hydrolase [Variovorax sp.]